MFLPELKRDLDEIRGKILGKNPLTSLTEVFAEVKREEGRRKIMLSEMKSSILENSALFSQNFPNAPQNRQPRKGEVCEQYKKLWHSAETCLNFTTNRLTGNQNLSNRKVVGVQELINLDWKNKTTLKNLRGQPLSERNN